MHCVPAGIERSRSFACSCYNIISMQHVCVHTIKEACQARVAKLTSQVEEGSFIITFKA